MAFTLGGADPRSLEESSEGQSSPPNQEGVCNPCDPAIPLLGLRPACLRTCRDEFQNPPQIPRASPVAQMVTNLPALQETQVRSLGGEDPLEKGMASPLQYSCLENPMDRGAWQATASGVTKSRTRLSD